MLLCAPLIFLALDPGEVDPLLRQHLVAVMLPLALAQTFSLLLLVGLGSLLLGIGLAWLVVRYEFSGRRWLEPGLALPLAFPAYVLAYVYVAGMAFDAPAASAWRSLGLPFDAFPEVRSVAGAALILTLALYPYVYLLVRAQLQTSGAATFEAARTLGLSAPLAFARVVLPSVRPAWIAGLGLVLLEVLADFGAMRMLGRDTLTTLVLQSWIGLGSLALAAELALAMLGVVVLVLLVHRLLAGAGSPLHPAGGAEPPPRVRLRGVRALLLALLAWMVLAAGVLWPLWQLLAWLPLDRMAAAMPWSAIRGTVVVAGLTALCAVAIGLGLAALQRRWPADRPLGLIVAFAGLGYAVPGAVMAVAVLWLLMAIEHALAPALAGLSTGLFALVLALLMRFQRVGISAAAAALASLRPQWMQQAAVLGLKRPARWWRVGLPVLTPGLIAAGLLVFVEVMKELPATLMLRPFGWDTLAIEIYTATTEGLWQDAALPALMLVVVGAIPLLWLLAGRGRQPV